MRLERVDLVSTQREHFRGRHRPETQKGCRHMKWRYGLLALCLVLLLALAREVAAQGPDGPPPMATGPVSPEQELKRLEKKLKLDPDQKSKIMPILVERSSAIKALMENREIPNSEKFPRLMNRNDVSNARIREALTEGQQRTFDKMVADEKRRLENGPEGGPPDGLGPPPQGS